MGIKSSIIKVLRKVLRKKEDTAFFTKDHFKDKSFKIGDYTYGVPSVYFENDEANLTIGKFCSIAGEVKIFLGGNHNTNWGSTYPFSSFNDFFPKAKSIKGHPATNGSVTIGNDVWIGYGATILSGVQISDGAVIAAGSLVTKNIGPFEIWGGNPAKFIKHRFDEESIKKLIEIKWWDWKIEEIESVSHILCSPYTEIIKYVESK